MVRTAGVGRRGTVAGGADLPGGNVLITLGQWPSFGTPYVQAATTFHELGHTLGLSHCDSERCVMNDAHGSIRPVDATDGRFCDHCARLLASVLPSI